MLVQNPAQAKKIVNKLLAEKPQVIRGSLFNVVKESLKKRLAILALAKKKPTPFYVFDQAAAQRSIDDFKSVFKRSIPNLEIYYAVKSNPHEYLLKTVAQGGLGFDVSSGRELNLVLKAGAKKIVFSGPGKTDAELLAAITQGHKLIINLDSFTELRRLGELLKKNKKTVSAGIRIYTKYHDVWTKFGIKLEYLPEFLQAAKKWPQIKLEGIQCHMSWNKTVQAYQNMLKEIAGQISHLPVAERTKIKFIDFGGGFETYRLEGYFPWTLPQGEIIKMSADNFGKKIKFTDKYYLADSVTLAAYAKGIAAAIKKHLAPLGNFSYFCEPGRAISTKSMHLVLKVMDVKDSRLAILDGGINMVGYELFEYFYYPTINLTRPAKKEIPCHLYGSLCTPYDLWAYYCYANAIKEGDIIMIPNQGAYAYTLAQNFIKPIPETYILK